jgi:phosphate-selective porin OprO and OprP
MRAALARPSPPMSVRLSLFLLLSLAAGNAAMAESVSPWTWRPTLALQYDLVHADGETLDGWRRLRPGLDLRHRDARVRLEYDTEAKRWTHAWVEVPAGHGRHLRMGQFKPPAGLEELSSGSRLPFMERSASRALASGGRRIGVQLESAIGGVVGQLMLGGKSLDRTPEGRLFAGRLYAGSARHHLGFSASREFPRGDSGRLVFRPEISLVAGGAVDSGTVDNVRHVDRAGLEGVWLHGPWTLAGEALWARLQRSPVPDIEGRGGYLALSWTPGGEGRSLRGGTLQAPKAEGKVAWEVGLRLAHADLRLAADPDGESDSLTLAVNAWLPAGGAVSVNQLWSRSDSHGQRRYRTVTALRLSWWY